MKKTRILTPYNFLLSVVALLNFGAILTPILAKLGATGVAKTLYFIYSLFCHQIHYRSMHIFEYQYAWCTRDTFIWLAILLTGVYVKMARFKGIKWHTVIPFVVPIALDGGIQLIATMLGLSDEASGPFYASTNLSRMVTGSLFGIGVGLWVFPIMEDAFEEKSKIILKGAIWQKLHVAVITIFVTLFVIYLALLGLWKSTTPNYPPVNFLESRSKFPEDKDEWLLRRKNGLCPVDINEGFFGLDCKGEDNE